MYRPTVRYPDIYKEFVDELFRLTGLDRNKIIRCCMFTSIYNPAFLKIMETYKHDDVPLPSPKWAINDHNLWLEQSGIPTKEEGIEDANMHGETTTTETPKLFKSAAATGSNGISISSTELKEQEKELSGRKQSFEGRKGAVPSIRVHGNGGIRLDFR